MRAEEQREKRGKYLTSQNSVASSNIHLIAGVSGIVYNVSPAFTKLTQHTIASLSRSGGLESIFENPNVFTEIIDTVQTNKDWTGHTIFLDENHDEYIAFIEAKPHKNSKQETELKLTFSDISKSKKNELIETRLLKAISVCTEALFSNTNSDVVAPPVLATIGKAMGIDRCYISKIVVEQGELYVERKYAWCKKPSLDNDYFASYSKFTYSSFFEVLDTLNAGKIVAITRRSKTGKEIMDILKKIDILSFLKIPIFKDNNLWGYIGFEDTENEREWSSAEKKALKSLAQNIGAHIKINSLTEELLNKNTQLENAIKGSSDGLWSVDNKADSFYISPQLYQIFGYTETTFPKSIEAIKQLLKTEETELLELEVIDAIKKQKANFEFETIAKHKTGKYIWLRGNLSLTYDEHGNVTKNSGSVADITTEKTFELRIRRQEEHYQRLVNGLKEVVFETDKEGKITFLNNSWKTLIGKTIKASTGKKLASFINKNHVDVFEEAMEQIRNKQSWPGRLELQIIKDKNPYWVELWMRGMYDSDYELTGISGSIFDINSKKIATEKLRESEERYRLISENTKDIVCLHDKDSNYVYISPSMYDTLGYPTRALLGQPAWTCIHPKDVDLLKQTFKQLINGKQPGFIRYRVKHRKGHYIWVETIANIQQQPQDSETQLLIQTSTRDINHQKKAEEEIIKALEKERHLVELRTNLINMISHEFRTPLTSIKSSSDLVLKYLPTLKKSNTKERLSTHFERIRVQVNRINELISGVLLLGGIDTDKVKFSPELLDLKGFTENFFVEYYETHTDDDRKVKVVFEGKQREVKVDKLLLTHILRNLISNALKYSKGSKNPEFNIKFERKNVVFIIKDYGIGIAEKDIQNLFQSFYRGDNALTIPGTGLGLVIVKQFIDMHNGDITLESRLNKGTIIQVTLPI